MTANSSETRSLQLILRWRWVILVAGVAGALGFELLDLFSDQDTNHTLEIALYGLLIAGIPWLLLTWLAREGRKQARFEQRLSQLRLFVRQLVESESTGQLLDFLARYPALMLPVTEATLYGYDYAQARFTPLSHYRPDSANASERPRPEPDGCAACQLHTQAHPHFTLCSTPAAPGSLSNACLPLSYNGLVLGRLRLSLAPETRLTPDNTQLLDALAPEIGLGLLLATARIEAVSAAQSAARHDERRQLSFTLHNSLAQQVGYLHLSLDRLSTQTRLISPVEMERELETLRDVAGDAYQQVRELLAGLRSPEYHSLGHLLEGRLQVFARNTGLETTFDMRGEPRLLSPELNQQVFGLIHEGLNNIQKHASARRVTLRLEWQAAELKIELADDGRGFAPEAAIQDGHYGLTMLQEYVTELRGSLAIVSAPGQGTRLAICIPLAPNLDFAPSASLSTTNTVKVSA